MGGRRGEEVEEDDDEDEEEDDDTGDGLVRRRREQHGQRALEPLADLLARDPKGERGEWRGDKHWEDDVYDVEARPTCDVDRDVEAAEILGGRARLVLVRRALPVESPVEHPRAVERKGVLRDLKRRPLRRRGNLDRKGARERAVDDEGGAEALPIVRQVLDVELVHKLALDAVEEQQVAVRLDHLLGRHVEVRRVGHVKLLHVPEHGRPQRVLWHVRVVLVEAVHLAREVRVRRAAGHLELDEELARKALLHVVNLLDLQHLDAVDDHRPAWRRQCGL